MEWAWTALAGLRGGRAPINMIPLGIDYLHLVFKWSSGLDNCNNSDTDEREQREEEEV
jgi:hypothetical protein